MWQILKSLVLFFVWNLLLGLALFLIAPPGGLLASLLLAWALLYGYLLRAGRKGRRRRWATLRLRPLGPAARWTAVAVPVVLVLSWAVGEVYTSLVPVPPESFNPFIGITDTPMGRLSLGVVAVAVAPIVEEFFFRGIIQWRLERMWGAAAGILGAAAIFAFIHLLPWVFPLHFFLGALFGCAVYVTRSIWAGVVLHAANNAAALFSLYLAGEADPRPTVWEAGPDADWWIALAVFLVSLAAALWIGRRAWREVRAGGGRTLAEGAGRPHPLI